MKTNLFVTLVFFAVVAFHLPAYFVSADWNGREVLGKLIEFHNDKAEQEKSTQGLIGIINMYRVQYAKEVMKRTPRSKYNDRGPKINRTEDALGHFYKEAVDILISIYKDTAIFNKDVFIILLRDTLLVTEDLPDWPDKYSPSSERLANITEKSWEERNKTAYPLIPHNVTKKAFMHVYRYAYSKVADYYYEFQVNDEINAMVRTTQQFKGDDDGKRSIKDKVCVVQHFNPTALFKKCVRHMETLKVSLRKNIIVNILNKIFARPKGD